MQLDVCCSRNHLQRHMLNMPKDAWPSSAAANAKHANKHRPTNISSASDTCDVRPDWTTRECVLNVRHG